MQQYCLDSVRKYYFTVKTLKKVPKSQSGNISLVSLIHETNSSGWIDDLELEFKENEINEEDHEDTKPDSWKMLTFWNWKN